MCRTSVLNSFRQLLVEVNIVVGFHYMNFLLMRYLKKPLHLPFVMLIVNSTFSISWEKKYICMTDLQCLEKGTFLFRKQSQKTPSADKNDDLVVL